MTDIKGWRQQIVAEKSLWQIFRRSPGFWEQPFHRAIMTITGLGLTTFSALHLTKPGWLVLPTFSVQETILAWANLGLTYSVTMLAFLLAGFTVFSTITKPQLFAELAQVAHPESTLSEFQYIFFSFMNVFIHYLTYMSVCAIILLFANNGGPLILLGECMKLASPTGFSVFQFTTLAVLGTWTILLFLKLKSFIYNLYAMIIVVVLHENQDEK